MIDTLNAGTPVACRARRVRRRLHALNQSLDSPTSKLSLVVHRRAPRMPTRLIGPRSMRKATYWASH
jgi:hypothetical protein